MRWKETSVRSSPFISPFSHHAVNSSPIKRRRAASGLPPLFYNTAHNKTRARSLISRRRRGAHEVDGA